jgi:hypothetical protein
MGCQKEIAERIRAKGADYLLVLKARGSIASVDGKSISIQTQDGATAELQLADDSHIFQLVPAKADSIKPEMVMGAAGKGESGERLTAVTVVLYPETTNADSEGYLTWDLTADSTMRTGVVKTVESSAEGQVVSITYPQGGATFLIPGNATVATLEDADMSALKKGAQVIVPSANKAADGKYTADAVAVAKEGFNPGT